MSKKTVETIVDSGNYYVLPVKANQATLLSAVREEVILQSPLSSFHQEEKGHGRHTSWDVFVFDMQSHPKAKEWKGLKRVIQVHRSCFDTKTRKTHHSERFYITNLYKTDAQYYGEGIRGHWLIENQLHWVKDVRHKEDKNGIHSGNGPVNISTISTIALNLHRKNGRKAIKDAQAYAMVNISAVFNEIRT